MKWYSSILKKTSVGKFLNKLSSSRGINIKVLRKFEKTLCRIATTKLDIRFLDRCEELGVVPKFLKFKAPELEAYGNINQFYRKALSEQKCIEKQKLKTTRREYLVLYDTVERSLSLCELKMLIHLINEQKGKKTTRDKETRHRSKLYNMWINQRPAVPDCIVNLSKYQLSLSERNALLFGPGHHILPKRIDEVAVKSQIESQLNRICARNKIKLSYDNKSKLREAADCFLHESKSVCSTRKNQALHRTLKALSSNTDIKCCKMDKGVGVVILDTKEYFSKLDIIVQDESRFKELEYNLESATTIQQCSKAPWILKESSISNYIRKYIRPLVEEKTYWKLMPRGSQPGRLYGMAKIHKEKCPLRPVLSAINTPEYALSKWIETQIKPFYNSKWSVSSTESLSSDLSTVDPNQSDIYVFVSVFRECIPVQRQSVKASGWSIHGIATGANQSEQLPD